MKTPTPLVYSTDCDDMHKALEWLKAAGVRYTQPTKWQIKLKDNGLSFYPSTGTIFRDGDERALPEKGLVALAALLKKFGPP